MDEKHRIGEKRAREERQKNPATVALSSRAEGKEGKAESRQEGGRQQRSGGRAHKESCAREGEYKMRTYKQGVARKKAQRI